MHQGFGGIAFFNLFIIIIFVFGILEEHSGFLDRRQDKTRMPAHVMFLPHPTFTNLLQKS